MKKRYLVLSSIAVVTLIMAVGCDDKFKHGGFEKKMFSKFDANGDGMVNQEEYLNMAVSRFERADENKDDKLSKEELKESRVAKRFPYIIEDYFKRNDTNNDDIISKEELTQGTHKQFKNVDSNNDNQLSAEEMKAHAKSYRTDRK